MGTPIAVARSMRLQDDGRRPFWTRRPEFEEEQIDADPTYALLWLGCRLDDGRYVVVRKLGYGKFSSVFLARDTSEDVYVAIKILTAQSTEDLLKELDGEVASLQHLRYAFRMAGPAGWHACLVTDVYGPTIAAHCRPANASPDDDIRAYRSAPLPLLRTAVRHVLVALDFLHTECRMVHGDLRATNIFLATPDMQALAADILKREPSSTYQSCTHSEGANYLDLSYCGSSLRPVSQPLTLSADCEGLSAVLGHLGSAHSMDNEEFVVSYTSFLQAPETILGITSTGAVDIWALGCMVFSCLARRPMIDLSSYYGFSSPAENEGMEAAKYSQEHDHLAKILESLSLNRYPDALLAAAGGRLFNDNGTVAASTTVNGVLRSVGPFPSPTASLETHNSTTTTELRAKPSYDAASSWIRKNDRPLPSCWKILGFNRPLFLSMA